MRQIQRVNFQNQLLGADPCNHILRITGLDAFHARNLPQLTHVVLGNAEIGNDAIIH